MLISSSVVAIAVYCYRGECQNVWKSYCCLLLQNTKKRPQFCLTEKNETLDLFNIYQCNEIYDRKKIFKKAQ